VSGIVIWITGLPAAGKSTLAERVRASLSAPAALLDGDALRDILGEAGYDAAGRATFYRRLGALAGLLAGQGLVVLVAATAHLRAHRAAARALAPRFLEVWVSTSRDDAERRDPKGLYARARAGAAPHLPGVGVPYEPPTSPDVVARGGRDDEAVSVIVRLAGS
jgi:adenylylsulfate kinase